MAKDIVDYVSMKAKDFASDEDWVLWNATQRGIYHSIIIYMLCNNGRIKDEPERIKKLSNVDVTFETNWVSVRTKFYKKGVYLRHRRVDSELRKAKKMIQNKIKAGLTSAAKRQQVLNSNITSDKSLLQPSKDKLSKVKLREEKESIRPTIQRVLDIGNSLGISEQHSVVWYEHYAAQGFYFSSGVAMTDLRMAMNRHKNNGTLAALVEKASKIKTPEQKAKIQSLERKREIQRIRDDYQSYLECKTTEALQDLKRDGGHLVGVCGWLIDEILGKRKSKG